MGDTSRRNRRKQGANDLIFAFETNTWRNELPSVRGDTWTRILEVEKVRFCYG